MNHEHAFLTVEGLSGSGKTTIARSLASQIGGLYYKSPPAMFGPIRDVVGHAAGSLSQFLFDCAGIAQASVEIATALKVGPVVCDKYLATVLAYSRARGLHLTFPGAEQLVMPDCSFLLDVDDSARLARVADRSPLSPRHRAFLKGEIETGVITHLRDLALVLVDNNRSGTAHALHDIAAHLMTCGIRLKA